LPIAVRRIARAAIDIIRLTFARERLGDAAGSAPVPARGSSHFLRMLVAIERLPEDPPAPPRPRRAPLLFRETLPVDPEPPPVARARRLTLRSLLARERLPLDPVPPARRRRNRLAALFAPESLDEP
jgi:hypothetical protein